MLVDCFMFILTEKLKTSFWSEGLSCEIYPLDSSEMCAKTEQLWNGNVGEQ